MTQFSQLGERFAAGSGILELMEDLGEALASGDDLCMLGGGNPAQVPGVTAALHQMGRTLLADSCCNDHYWQVYFDTNAVLNNLLTSNAA